MIVSIFDPLNAWLPIIWSSEFSTNTTYFNSGHEENNYWPIFVILSIRNLKKQKSTIFLINWGIVKSSIKLSNAKQAHHIHHLDLFFQL